MNEENNLDNNSSQDDANAGLPQSPQASDTPQNPPTVYQGPVSQSGTESPQVSESFNSLNQEKPHKKKALLIGFLFLAMIAVIVIVVLLSGSDDSEPVNTNTSESSAVEDTEELEESTTALTDEERQQALAEQEAAAKKQLNEEVAANQAKARDAERKSDINTMYQKLEEYFNENGYYPTEQFSATLFPGADPESFLDPNNVRISQLGRLSSDKPESPFTPGTEPSGSQYSYIAYQCTSPLPGEGKCNRYLISAWLETEDSVYIKESLN